MRAVLLLSLALASSSLGRRMYMQVKTYIQIILRSRVAQTQCASNATRVVRFTSVQFTYAGIVEVCLNGVWGTVCTDSPNTLWSEKNAQVFCQGLGFSGVLNPVDQST